MIKRIYEKIKHSTVYDIAIKTPLDRLPELSTRLNNSIYLKREDLQPVRSFKIRGAYNKISQLSVEDKEKGILAASAGNHAQGVALSAQKLGLKATIVMPATTPDIKVSSVHRYGATVILFGDTFDEAYAHSQELMLKTGATFIHPYDDEDVMAGQGSVGLELLEQLPKMDMLFVPVGGGGLLGGILAYIKTERPEIKIIAVESEESACLYEALKAKKIVSLDRIGIFADGVAVRQIGTRPFNVVKDLIDDVITVTTDQICASIKDIYDNCRAISEPAGALSLAGMKTYINKHQISGASLVAINCGANMDFDRLRHISERAEIGEAREAIFSVCIPEKPGSFKGFCEVIGARSVTEFNYRYADNAKAYVFVGISVTPGDQDTQKVLGDLHKAGYTDTYDLTHNEVAKLHIRHMVGGKASGAEHERLYRFQFPERPGALMKFLVTLGGKWNISLFHYRNHGSDYGRVLVGIQVPETDTVNFQVFLDALGYWYQDESKNAAYGQFL